MNPLARCPYCSARSELFVSSRDRNRHTVTDTFNYYQCSSCKLVFMNPIPPDVVPFYAGGYQPLPADLSSLRQLATTEQYRMEPVLRYKQRGRLLEIGPWIGIFSLNAKNAGFEVTAIERDQSCVDFLNTVVGIRALQSSDPAACLEELEEQFDVIALWHSLEHLMEPWRVIENAARRLASGGILIIAVPNIESYQFSLLKAKWKHLDAPRHLFFYPAGSLKQLCQKCGLTAAEITTSDELSDRLSLDAWRDFVLSMVPVRYVRGALAYALRYAARTKERRINAGAGLTAIFQLTANADRDLIPSAQVAERSQSSAQDVDLLRSD